MSAHKLLESVTQSGLQKAAANAPGNSIKMSMDTAYAVSAQDASMASRYNALTWGEDAVRNKTRRPNAV